MKKIISLFISLIMLVGILAGCSEPSVDSGPDINDQGGGGLVSSLPDGLSGEDVAKLLLAGQRLGGNMIDNEDGFFEGGVETYRALAAAARKNGELPVVTLGARSEGVSSMLATRLSDTAADEPNLSVDYSQFDEISRNYAEFASTSAGIASDAERAADDISFVKKHIRLLDVWVSFGSQKYFLHVEENSETVIVHSDLRLDVCHRYKNAEGEDVYELYVSNADGYTARSTYISGKRYERTVYDGSTSERYQGISASNDKGYWEVLEFIYDSGWVENQFSIDFIFMKDDICYRALYDHRAEAAAGFKITSPDKKCDIMYVFEYGNNQIAFELNLGAFTGFVGVRGDGYSSEASLVLKDGRTMNSRTPSSDDGSVWINGVYASESAFGHEGSVILNVIAGSIAECREKLILLLRDWGIECKYDMNKVYDSLDTSAADFERAHRYIKWNGVNISNEQGLLDALSREKQRFEAMRGEYDEVKDRETVDMADANAYELLINFSPVTAELEGAASLAEGIAAIGKISLTLSDTILMVEEEPYHVAFALKSNSDGTLSHIDCETVGTPYTDGRSFTVTASDVSFALPMLHAGEYTLVAYVATEEGIRSSDFCAVKLSECDTYSLKAGNIVLSYAKAQDGSLTVTYSESYDAEISILHEGETAESYSEFHETLANAVYTYGTPDDALIERIDENGTATALTGEETAISDGCYRLGYTVNNGDKTVRGFVYVNYSISIVIPET